MFSSPTAEALSKWVARQWRNSSAEVKHHFNKLAEEERYRHRLRFPDYQYQPRRPKRKQDVDEDEDNEEEVEETQQSGDSLVLGEVSDVGPDTSPGTSFPTTPTGHISSSSSPGSSSASTSFPSPLDSSTYPRQIVPPSLNIAPCSSSHYYGQQPSTPTNVPSIPTPNSFVTPQQSFFMSSVGSTGLGMSFSDGNSAMPFNANGNTDTILPQVAFAPSYNPQDGSLIKPQLQFPGDTSFLSSSQFEAEMNDAKLGYIHSGGQEVELPSGALRIDQQASQEYFTSSAQDPYQAGPSSFTSVPSSSSFNLASSTSSSATGPSTSFALYDYGLSMSDTNDDFVPDMAYQAGLDATAFDEMDFSWLLQDDILGSTVF